MEIHQIESQNIVVHENKQRKTQISFSLSKCIISIALSASLSIRLGPFDLLEPKSDEHKMRNEENKTLVRMKLIKANVSHGDNYKSI